MYIRSLFFPIHPVRPLKTTVVEVCLFMPFASLILPLNIGHIVTCKLGVTIYFFNLTKLQYVLKIKIFALVFKRRCAVSKKYEVVVRISYY